MSDVTRILQSIEAGDPKAADELLPLVYDELRKLAAARMARENPGATLSATSLVHEAYVRLVEVDAEHEAQRWNSRGHFFAAAAEAMRRILIEQARRKQSRKHGGGMRRHSLEGIEITASQPTGDLLALDDALQRFEKFDRVAADLVKLRYFAGLTIPEAAKAVGVSSTTADRYWSYARAWLHAELEGPDGGNAP
jgi:RNA polymerase sigma factor (TIGR02999 family)